MIAGSTLMAPPNGDVARSDAPRALGASTVTDPRVHADSAFRPEVQQLLQNSGLRRNATGARAFHNDVEVTMSEAGTAFIASTTCDQQRDFAAALWMEWPELGDVPSAGAGVNDQVVNGSNARECRTGIDWCSVPLRVIDSVTAFREVPAVVLSSRLRGTKSAGWLSRDRSPCLGESRCGTRRRLVLCASRRSSFAGAWLPFCCAALSRHRGLSGRNVSARWRLPPCR